jgi:hypothetical protein
MIYIDPTKGKQISATDPRMLATKEARIASAQAAQAAFEDAFGLKFRCPMCKQPQSSPDCERREHWGC